MLRWKCLFNKAKKLKRTSKWGGRTAGEYSRGMKTLGVVPLKQVSTFRRQLKTAFLTSCSYAVEYNKATVCCFHEQMLNIILSETLKEQNKQK